MNWLAAVTSAGSWAWQFEKAIKQISIAIVRVMNQV
jgi:hypothetical protein